MFIADLHIHSKYSRATARDCDVEHLAIWAQKKGIGVVGTGDFTHPAWRAELKRTLVADGRGLFALRPEISRQVEAAVPEACRAEVRFLLTAEISTIYKHGDRTRKVHHVLLAPHFEAVEKIVAALGRIGNLASDGRPILGLSLAQPPRDRARIRPGSALIPAHIWTPWFAALGSKSGYDAIDDCYGDLAPHIFAVETGLSSDPAMNWRVSGLDRFRLISNSDAHSPSKLGREATCFTGERSYEGILTALREGRGYDGTIEFFPEEGKYHADGHLACKQRLTPDQTRLANGRCPACGGAITVGVLHRVEALADRPEGCEPPATAGKVRSLIPLTEVLSEITGRGAATKGVAAHHERLLQQLGPELAILLSTPVDQIGRCGPAELAEGIARLRRGEAIREPGYDGQYGVIRLFAPGERPKPQ